MFVFNATISGRIFVDTNRNHQNDSRDLGLVGIGVNLVDADGNVVATTSTNSLGEYRFQGVQLGQYTVQPVLKTGQTQTSPTPEAYSITRGMNVSRVDFTVALPVITPPKTPLPWPPRHLTDSLPNTSGTVSGAGVVGGSTTGKVVSTRPAVR